MTAISSSPAAASPWFRRRSWPLVALIIGLVVILIVVIAGRASAPDAEATTPAKPPLELAAADIATVVARPLARTLPLSGTLTPLQQATLRARVAGQVTELSVREGDAVRAGAVLARLDTRIASARRAEQQAAVDKARAELALADTNLSMNAQMLTDHFISRNAYEVVRSGRDAAAATLRLAEAQLAQARTAVADATIVAPFDGIVSQRLVQVGETVGIDAAVVALVDLSRMELQAAVPADDVAAVRVGQRARFTVGAAAAPGTGFDASVVRINPATDAGTRAIRVHFAVDNPEGRLRGGQFATGTLALDETGPVPVLPSRAIRRDAGVAYVLVLDGDRLKRVDVEPGLVSADGQMIELRQGPAVGSEVVAARIDTLTDGSAIRRAAPSSPAAN